ncbi:MAG: hypothetical protein Q7V57_03085 [Actinomycetota bacterium]|nr:hypothetical protein [Actinomycetota bacterium]
MLNAHGVDYLLVGGYAVAFHGFARATVDMEVWVAVEPGNAERLVAALGEFGFDLPELSVDLFLQPERLVRMGVAPLRIELLTSIDGVTFRECRERSVSVRIGDLDVPVIALADLRANKLAAGRTKDQLDLENLPEA